MNDTAKRTPDAAGAIRDLDLDFAYLERKLLELLAIPSPSGFTDEIVTHVCAELTALGVPYELTRRGAIRADLKGDQTSPDRAIVAHLDTLGAMVKYPKENGRLQIVPIGTWSARFAEGARVTLFTDSGRYRGTILPVKASGHVFNKEIDSLPIGWENVELRIDAECDGRADLKRLGINIGDFIAVDPTPEITDSGYINSRHLDDKAGVAALLTATKAIVDHDLRLPVDCHILFTISEEVGVGASAVLHGDIAEMVGIDNGTIAPGQNTSEKGVTIAIQDSSGPFDYHLTHKLIGLCDDFGLEYARDVFRYYRSDNAAAIEAGNDLRTALLCFGLDASHGHERVHRGSLETLARLIVLYAQSEPTFRRDRFDIGPFEDFPERNEPEAP